jgi:hypothetical protein
MDTIRRVPIQNIPGVARGGPTRGDVSPQALTGGVYVSARKVKKKKK